MASNRKQFLQNLAEELEVPVSRLEGKSNSALLARWLQYNGIIGYEYDIIEAVQCLWNVKLED